MKRVMFFLLILIGSLFSFDGESTVNKTKGEMSFAYPLGVVEGKNGNSFPVTLNYRAGIRYDQPSGNVGLGFSVNEPCITRRVVMIPDDTQHLYHDVSDKEKTTFWGWFLSILAVVVTIISYGSTSSICTFVLIAVSVAKVAVTIPEDYRAGGAHSPFYDFDDKGRIEESGFLEGGHLYDMPDIYFVNTPWISGKMIWYGSKEEGGFRFSPDSDRDIDIEYKSYNEGTGSITAEKTFIITLEDKTELIFDLKSHSPMGTHSHGGAKANGKEYHQYIKQSYSDGIVQAWHLTRVNFGGDNKDFIKFKYSSKGYEFSYRLEDKRHSGHRSSNRSIEGNTNNNTLEDCFKSWGKALFYNLDSVISPCDTAVFNNVNDKVDYTRISSADLPSSPPEDTDSNKVFSSDSAMVLRDKLDSLYAASRSTRAENLLLGWRLNDIVFLNSKGIIKNKVTFHTSYKLRPATPNAVNSSNTDGKNLTLDSISNTIANSVNDAVVKFDYNDFNPRYSEKYINDEIAGSLLEEHRDNWGYYNPKSLNDIDGSHLDYDYYKNYASAWSLKSVTFPNGKEVEWVYEPNSYMAQKLVEGVPNSTSSIYYGGGIRVKKIIERDFMGDSLTTRFHYAPINENSTGDKAISALSSGVGNCFPYPNLSNVDKYGDPTFFDNRLEKDRGGFYTAATINYGAVVTQRSNTPGFIEERYTNAADYPNEGYYGQVDMGFARGLLKSRTVYDANFKVLSKTENTYEITTNDYMINSKYNNCGGLERLKNGRVNLKKVVNNNRGVEETTTYSFNDDNSSYSKSLHYKDIYHINSMQMGFSEAYSDFQKKLSFNNSSRIDFVKAQNKESIGLKIDFSVKVDVDNEINYKNNTYEYSWQSIYVSTGDLTEKGLNIFDNIFHTGDVRAIDIVNNDLYICVSTKATEVSYNESGTIKKAPAFILKVSNYSSTDKEINGSQVEMIPIDYIFSKKFETHCYPSTTTFTDLDGNGKPELCILNNQIGEYKKIPSWSMAVVRDIEAGTLSNVELNAFPDNLSKFFSSFDVSKWENQLNTPTLKELMFYDKHGDGCHNDLIYYLSLGEYNVELEGMDNIDSDGEIVSYQNSEFYELDKELENIKVLYNYFEYKEKANTIFFNPVQKNYSAYRNLGDVKRDELVLFRNPNPVVKESRPRARTTNLSNGQFLNVNTIAAKELGRYITIKTDGKELANSPVISTQSIGNETISGSLMTLKKWPYEKWGNGAFRWGPDIQYVYSGNPQDVKTETIYPDLLNTNWAGMTWKEVQKVTRINTDFMPIEVITKRNGNDIYESRIFSGEYKHLVGTIFNASYIECGVYTCNFIEPGNLYCLDQPNGWMKPDPYKVPKYELALVPNNQNIGQYALELKNTGEYNGIKRLFNIKKGKDYILSAWVKSSDKIDEYPRAMLKYYYPELNDTSNSLSTTGHFAGHNGYYPTAVKVVDESKDGWKLVEIKIEASSEVVDDDWDKFPYLGIEISVGHTAQLPNNADIYLQDIRFFPSDAYVNTIYYDSTFRSPIQTVGVDGIPSEMKVLDRKGRLARIIDDGDVLAEYKYESVQEQFDSEKMYLRPFIDSDGKYQVRIRAPKEVGNVNVYFSISGTSGNGFIASTIWLKDGRGISTSSYDMETLKMMSKSGRIRFVVEEVATGKIAKSAYLEL